MVFLDLCLWINEIHSSCQLIIKVVNKYLTYFLLLNMVWLYILFQKLFQINYLFRISDHHFKDPHNLQNHTIYFFQVLLNQLIFITELTHNPVYSILIQKLLSITINLAISLTEHLFHKQS